MKELRKEDDKQVRKWAKSELELINYLRNHVGQCHNCFQKYIDYLMEDLVDSTPETETLVDTFKHADGFALGLFDLQTLYPRFFN